MQYKLNIRASITILVIWLTTYSPCEYDQGKIKFFTSALNTPQFSTAEDGYAGNVRLSKTLDTELEVFGFIF